MIDIIKHVVLVYFGLLVVLTPITSGQDRIPRSGTSIDNNVLAEIQVVCHSDAIMLKMNTNRAFNGMIYPKGLSNNSTCMTEYYSSKNISYKLPLKSCNTMSSDVDDGVEYFNTVMVQPHMRLLTNQGKGYHIRCKYQTREKTIANTQFNVSLAGSTPLLATASMPSCTMKIFRSGTSDDVAESVKIGDKLIMVIEIDQQDMYGMKITSCVVRDGLNMAEQPLINDNGCPLDETIMPQFEYTNNYTRSAVSFPAHKFPHTSSVYYQCNVRLCIKDGGCELPECSSKDGPRKKRYVDQGNPQANTRNGTHQRDAGMSFDVYSGLYVNDMDTTDATEESKQSLRQVNSDQLCLPLGQLVVAVSIGLVVLMLVAILVFSCNYIRLCHTKESTMGSCSYPFHSEQQSAATRSYFDGSTC